MAMNRSPVQTKRDAVRVLKTHGRAIRSLGVKRLGLFGSLVNQKPESDVDLLVDFDPHKNPSITFLSCRCCLSKFLDAELNWLHANPWSIYLS